MEEGGGQDQPGCSVCGVVEATHAPCRALRRTRGKLEARTTELRRAVALLTEAEKSCVNPVAMEIRKLLKELETDKE